jgi:hypothetical protein
MLARSILRETGPIIQAYIMKTKRAAVILALSVLALPAAWSLEWQPFGARSMAMGDSGVALAKGPLGAYWNPAGLAQEENPSGTAFGVGAQAILTGSLIQGANDMYNAVQAIQTAVNQGDVFDAARQLDNAKKALSEFGGPGSGVSLDMPVALFNIKIGNFTLFVNDFNYVGLSPFVDTLDEGILKTLPNGLPNPNYIGNNLSGMVARGLSVGEVGVGYAHELPWDGFYLGGNLKALVGVTAYDQVAAAQFNNSNIPTPDKTNYDVNGQLQPGVDLGFLWDVDKTYSGALFHPRLGFTARNINNPKFDQPSASQLPLCIPGQTGASGCVLIAQPSKMAVGSQARLGVALSPLHFINLTADVDVTKNPTLVNGYYSQMLGAGAEFNIFNLTWLNIPLRVGIEDNLAQAHAPAVVTAGFGLNFLHLVLDFAAEVTPSLQTISYQSNNQTTTMRVPSEVGFMFQAGLQFGGAPKLTKQEKAEIERFSSLERIAAIKPAWMETPATSLPDEAAWDKIREAVAADLGGSILTDEKDNFTTKWMDVPSAQLARPALAELAARYPYGQVRLKFLKDTKSPFATFLVIESRARISPERRGIFAGFGEAPKENSEARIGGRHGIVLNSVIPFNASDSPYARRVQSVLYDALKSAPAAPVAPPQKTVPS